MGRSSTSWKKVTLRQANRFKDLCWPQIQPLLRTALLLTHEQASAEDLVQETMLKALRAIDRFRNGTDIKAWLMTIMRRTHIDMARHASVLRLSPLVGEDAWPDRSVAEQIGDSADNAAADLNKTLGSFDDVQIIQAVRALPKAIRWTILLADVEEICHRDIATILGVPLGTIKSRVHRGHAILYDRLYGSARRYQLVA